MGKYQPPPPPVTMTSTIASEAKTEGDSSDGVDELSLPDTLPSDRKSLYGWEMMRLVRVCANYTGEPVEEYHVELVDVFDLASTWGLVLAGAAMAIARDLYDGDVSEIGEGFFEALTGHSKAKKAERKRAFTKVIEQWLSDHPTVSVDADLIVDDRMIADHEAYRREDDDIFELTCAERWLRDHPGEVCGINAWKACVGGGRELVDADDAAELAAFRRRSAASAAAE